VTLVLVAGSSVGVPGSEQACAAATTTKPCLVGLRQPPGDLDHLAYTLARRTDEGGAAVLAGLRGTEVLTRRLDGTLLALFAGRWRLAAIQRDLNRWFDRALIDKTAADVFED
jgi:hypothetical protein